MEYDLSDSQVNVLLRTQVARSSSIAPETTVVQPDPFSARQPDPTHVHSIFQSLEDRLLFRQAQGILAGLTDCGHVAAARSLRTTAAELNLDMAALATKFLGCLAEPSIEPAKTLLLRIAVLALLPDGAARGRAPGGPDVSPADELGAGRGQAGPAFAVSIAPSASGISVHGVLDAATVPLLHVRTRSLSLARAPMSSNGEAFQLDLRGLTHLDGAGLRALDALATRVCDGGSSLRVVTPLSAGVRRLLDFAVSMRWLPATFDAKSSASMRPHGGRTGPRPAGWTPEPSHSARLAELEALYDCYASACWSLARRLLEDDGTAEAVVQTAFLDAWQQLTSGTPPAGQAGGQLLRRTHQEAVHRLRDARTKPPPLTRAPDDEPPAPLHPSHALRLPPSHPGSGFSGLPEEQARALGLAFWGGLTVQEIAATTGSPLADVRANLLAGVRTLAQRRDHQGQRRNVPGLGVDAR